MLICVYCQLTFLPSSSFFYILNLTPLPMYIFNFTSGIPDPIQLFFRLLNIASRLNDKLVVSEDISPRTIWIDSIEDELTDCHLVCLSSSSLPSAGGIALRASGQFRELGKMTFQGKYEELIIYIVHPMIWQVDPN